MGSPSNRIWFVYVHERGAPLRAPNYGPRPAKVFGPFSWTRAREVKAAWERPLPEEDRRRVKWRARISTRRPLRSAYDPSTAAALGGP